MADQRALPLSLHMMLDTQSPAYAGGQFAAVGTIILTLSHWLPQLALIAPLGWYAVLFYDRFFKKKEESEEIKAARIILMKAAIEAKNVLQVAATKAAETDKKDG